MRTGRPRILSTAQIRYVKRARLANVPMVTIARSLGVCRCTLYRTLRRLEVAG